MLSTSGKTFGDRSAKTGIHPFNHEILIDENFLCSAVTDRDQVAEHHLPLQPAISQSLLGVENINEKSNENFHQHLPLMDNKRKLRLRCSG